MTQPLISVMIGVYNARPYLAEAIDSVFAQTYRPLELIVVDDGSDDGSDKVAQSYDQALRYIRQDRQGNGSARNSAVAVAGGEFYAFLDADDRFVPDKLERQMQAFVDDPELDLVFGHVAEFISPEIDDETKARLRQPTEEAPWAAPNLMLIKRESFHRAGLFSTELRVGVTVDWYARAMEAGLKKLVLPHVVLERRIHTENNGIRERESRSQYVRVLKESMDRRRRLQETKDLQ